MPKNIQFKDRLRGILITNHTSVDELASFLDHSKFFKVLHCDPEFSKHPYRIRQYLYRNGEPIMVREIDVIIGMYYVLMPWCSEFTDCQKEGIEESTYDFVYYNAYQFHTLFAIDSERPLPLCTLLQSHGA